MARLDEDKVRELWERYKYQGDRAARDRLILLLEIARLQVENSEVPVRL